MHIKEGERLMLAFPSANLDPAKYPNPGQFDLERGAAQQLGMGVGTHFCLGAWLAKSISAMTLRELLRRCPNFSVDHEPSRGRANRSSLTTLPARPRCRRRGGVTSEASSSTRSCAMGTVVAWS